MQPNLDAVYVLHDSTNLCLYGGRKSLQHLQHGLGHRAMSLQQQAKIVGLLHAGAAGAGLGHKVHVHSISRLQSLYERRPFDKHGIGLLSTCKSADPHLWVVTAGAC